MHKQFDPHVQFLRTIQKIGPQIPSFQKTNDRRVWVGTDEELQVLEDKQDKTTAEENLLGNVTCTICLDVRKQKEDLWILPCRHLFHKACILNWARTKNTCPECKVSFDFVPEPAVNDHRLLLKEDNKRSRDIESGIRYTGDLDALIATPFPVLYTYGLQVVIVGTNVYRGSQIKGCIADVVDIIQYGEFIKVAVRGYRNYTTTFNKRYFRALPVRDENFMSLADIFFGDSSDEDE